MGMIALRGLPSDYDVWEQMGARNWGWRDVVPTFQAMIDDHDAAGPNRNVRGPNIVRRLPRDSWPAYMHRIEDALIAQGVPSHANAYETDDDGFFPTPLSQDHERGPQLPKSPAVALRDAAQAGHAPSAIRAALHHDLLPVFVRPSGL
jgi:5-(hydroxymethyl)furfural/furfural oxidase